MLSTGVNKNYGKYWKGIEKLTLLEQIAPVE